MSHGISQLEDRNWFFRGNGRAQHKEVEFGDEVYPFGPKRYTLTEYFQKKPGINADIVIDPDADSASTVLLNAVCGYQVV